MDSPTIAAEVTPSRTSSATAWGSSMIRYAEREALDDPSATPYGYGYVNQRAFVAGAPASSRWRTIMAIFEQCDDAGFASCGKLLRFSNPQQTFNGDPLGCSGLRTVVEYYRAIGCQATAQRRANDFLELPCGIVRER